MPFNGVQEVPGSWQPLACFLYCEPHVNEIHNITFVSGFSHPVWYVGASLML